MNRRAAILATVGALLAAEVIGAQRPDRRALDAEFRLAARICGAPADSGSAAEALATLTRIAAQDPNYPGLKALQERCAEELRKQHNQEDLLFAEAKSAYERRALEEARFKFQSLAARNTAHAAEAKRYLSLIAGAGPAAASPTSQQDYDNFELAKRHFIANNYDKAKPLFEMLLGKGGNLAPEARKYLDQIELRSKNAQLLQQGIRAYGQRRYQEALEIFQRIQQQDPGYPGLGRWISEAYGALGKTGARAADSSGVERGKGLFAQKEYTAALKLFREVQSSQPDSPDIQSWIQKTEAAISEQEKRDRLDRLVAEGQALLRRKDYVRAHVQFRRALALSPDDEQISKLLAQAAAGMKQSGQTPGAEDRSAYLATYLENGVRQFYAGNFAETNRLLEQYIQENGKHAALAYFYLGAVASTEFFLGGAKDREKEARARQFFAKGRQVNARFDPPREWVSPKIIAIYEKAVAGR